MATSNADPEFDAWKIAGSEGAPQIFTLSGDNEKLSINSLPLMEETTIVPLNFEMTAQKPVTLTFTGFESFDASVNVFLKDELAKQTINLRNQPVYTFSHNPENAANRFKLIFGGTSGFEESESLSGNMWIANNTVYISTPKLVGEIAMVEVFNTSGQVVFSKQVTLSELTKIPVNLNGFFVCRVTTSKELLVKKGFFR